MAASVANGSHEISCRAFLRPSTIPGIDRSSSLRVLSLMGLGSTLHTSCRVRSHASSQRSLSSPSRSTIHCRYFAHASFNSVTTGGDRSRPVICSFSRFSDALDARSCLALPSSASRRRCSTSSLRRRSKSMKWPKSLSNSLKISTLSVNSLSTRSTTDSILSRSGSRWPAFFSVQPIADMASSFSSFRTGCPPRLKKLLSLSATLSTGI